MFKSKQKSSKRGKDLPISNKISICCTLCCDLNQHIQTSRTVPHWSYRVISPAGGSFLNTEWSEKETTIYTHTEKTSSSIIFSVQSIASLHFQKYGHSRNLSPKTFSKHCFNCLVLVLATSSEFSSTWQRGFLTCMYFPYMVIYQKIGQKY